MTSRRNWTDDEVRNALVLYLRLPFGQFHKGNPQVRALANRIGRTPSAVALKLGNLAALDDSLPQKGMANASAMDRKIWTEFLGNPDPVLNAFERQNAALPGFSEARQVEWEGKQSQPTSVAVKQRRGQAFFRDMVLTSYRSRCALTGTDDPRLLTASHIIGWQEAVEHRMKPTNGICLNALHDRAFDRHLMSFDENYRIIIADDVPLQAQAALMRGASERLEMPDRFLPDQAFLAHHRSRMAERLTHPP